MMTDVVSALDLDHPTYMASSGTVEILSEDEKKERKALEEEHRVLLKQAKLNIFKKCQKELRQHVINSFLWAEVVEEMNGATVGRNQRLIDLDNKKSNVLWSGGLIDANYLDTSAYITLGPLLPKDISFDDLKQAHLEACAEESLLESSDAVK